MIRKTAVVYTRNRMVALNFVWQARNPELSGPHTYGEVTVDLVARCDLAVTAMYTAGLEPDPAAKPARVKFWQCTGVPVRADHFDATVYAIAKQLNRVSYVERVVDILATYNFELVEEF